MPAIQVIFGVILLLFSIAITVIVILQEGHQQNMGAITGGADTITVGFFILVIAINIFMFFS